MPTMAIIGSQWGDEGKGKIVDLLSEKAEIIARYQGGTNAGHTVVIDGKQFILHLIPSGILRPKTICVIGNGVVVDLEAMVRELEELESLGIKVAGRLLVSDRAHIIMPYHRELDGADEDMRGSNGIGTTRRGIGPAYSDKTSRLGIRLGDLGNLKLFKQKVERALREKNFLLTGHYRRQRLSAAKVIADTLVAYRCVKSVVADTTTYLNEAISKGKRVLVEGAQGVMLDVDFGTYPYCTSSNPTAGGICTGLGIPPRDVGKIYGVTKAYTTRVGAGPFPTELNDRMGKTLRQAGAEYGATTGRPRRCGWLDLPVVRYSAQLNGFAGLFLTKLDVLSGIKKIKVCTAYKCKGKLLKTVPGNVEELAACKPVYKEVPGWDENIVGCNDIKKLPLAARRYIQFIEKESGVKVSLISTGNDRKHTILRGEKFF